MYPIHYKGKSHAKPLTRRADKRRNDPVAPASLPRFSDKFKWVKKPKYSEEIENPSTSFEFFIPYDNYHMLAHVKEGTPDNSRRTFPKKSTNKLKSASTSNLPKVGSFVRGYAVSQDGMSLRRIRKSIEVGEDNRNDTTATSQQSNSDSQTEGKNDSEKEEELLSFVTSDQAEQQVT